MFSTILPQFGIKVRFAAPNDYEGIKRSVNEKTRLLYAETIGNPVLDVADIKRLSQIAGEYHLPLVVDSTFTTPFLLRPIEHGANIVVHSLTKWMGGHGTGIGGVVVDAGNFDWKDEKFTLFNKPDPSYFGIRFAHDLGDLTEQAFILRMRLVPLRNLGACISPDNAWMFLQGLETLPLRMERHCSNASAVAGFLSEHPKVKWVRYPGLPSDPSHPVASKYLTSGCGSMVVFGLKDGYDAAVRLIDNIELFSHLANVGDAKSLILHPSSTSHSQLSEEQQAASGLTPELIRLSIGIEHIDDILSALEKGLEQCLRRGGRLR
jgi:O-acetylhomoserine (thiol)-lyase